MPQKPFLQPAGNLKSPNSLAERNGYCLAEYH